MGLEWVLEPGSGECGDCIGLALYYMHSIASLNPGIQRVWIGMGQSHADLMASNHLSSDREAVFPMSNVPMSNERGKTAREIEHTSDGVTQKCVGICGLVAKAFRHSVRPMGAELVLRMDRYISPYPIRTSHPRSKIRSDILPSPICDPPRQRKRGKYW